MQTQNLFTGWLENGLNWLSRQSIWVASLLWLLTAAGCILLLEFAFKIVS